VSNILFHISQQYHFNNFIESYITNSCSDFDVNSAIIFCNFKKSLRTCMYKLNVCTNILNKHQFNSFEIFFL